MSSFSDYTASEYYDLVDRLLPRGLAWELGPVPLAPSAAVNGMSQTVLALAYELARAHNRLLDLLDESDPRTALELLAAWERVLGLPDVCDPSPPTSTADRQAACHARMVARGGTQLQLLCDAIEAAGYTGVEVQQVALLRADISTADSRVYDEEWSAHWYVWLAATPPQGWDRLVCLLSRIKPSYSTVQAIDGLRANEVSLPT